MKKTVLIVIAGLMLIGVNVFADDVEIDQSGNITTGISSSGNLEVTGASAEKAVVGISSGTGGTGVRGENTNGNFGMLGHDQYGVYGSGSPWAGYFEGHARVTGNLTVNGTINYTETDPTVNDLGKATLSCLTDQVAKYNGSIWACADDEDTGTTYSPGTGLDLVGTTFSVEVPLTLSGSSASHIISGTNSAASGTGVSGRGDGSGGRGIFGYSPSSDGTGVYGSATGTAGTGFYGFVSGWNGRAVQGNASYTGSTGTNYGGYFQAAGDTGRGVFGEASKSGAVTNYGGYFEAAGDTGFGVNGSASGSDGVGVNGSASGSDGVGVKGEATNTGFVTNYGGYFEAAGETGRGVYGHSTNSAWETNYGGYFEADGITGRGVYGKATYSGGLPSNNYGGYFVAAGSQGTGVHGSGSDEGVSGFSSDGIGVDGSATGSDGVGVNGSASGIWGVGVKGEATNTGGAINYGGYFKAAGDASYGVYAESTGGVGIGVYGIAPYAAGHFESPSGIGVIGSGLSNDFYAVGPGTNYGSASSIRWKENIKEIDNAVDKVLNIRGVYFDWDEEHGGKHDMGYIAEEVGEVIPEIVAYEPDGIYATGVDYGAITPILVQAIKEQQLQIDQLKAEISELKKQKIDD